MNVDLAMADATHVALQHMAGMLIFGATVLLVALTIDHAIEVRKRNRLKEWQKGRDGTRKKRWWQ